MDDSHFLAKLRPPPATPEDEICKCADAPPIKLMQALSDNPIHCLNCNLEVQPESLPLTSELVDAIASWRNVYDAVDRLWLASGDYEQWAEGELANIDSPINREGRQVRGLLDPLRRCYYWYHVGESEGITSTCPSCRGALRLYTKGIYAQGLCESCSIVVGSVDERGCITTG